ncbi:MAG TPA: SMP-30/gluconolactonase/LRE family protein [Mucilaginibacter sp.]
MKSIGKIIIAVSCSLIALTAFTTINRPASRTFKNSQADTVVNDIVEPGTKPQLISRQFAFAEGPSVDKKGNIFFSDQPNDKIWEYDTDGKLSVFLDKTGRANGMYFDKKGNLIACADEKNEIWSISPNKEITVLLKDYQGHLFNGPNDLWIAPNGGMYLSDPFYQRNYWTRKGTELDGEKVYYLPKGSQTAVIVVSDMKKPNGIVGTADGKYLFVSDIEANKTYKYRINKDGSLTDKTLFCDQGSDGMTLDSKGDVFMTGRGVTIYNAKGQKIVNFPIPESWTSNVCLGGKNKDLLFITASKGIYTLQTKVKGIE